MRLTMKHKWNLPIVLLALILAACNTTPPPDGGNEQVILADNTNVADEATRRSLTFYDLASGVLRFDSETEQLQALAPGDILVSEPVAGAAPYGFLRKVTAKRNEGSQVVLETTQATLEEAIKQGSLSLERRLTPSDIQSSQVLVQGGRVRLNENLTPQQADYPWNYEFSEVLVGDPSDPDNQVRIDGHFNFEPTLKIELDYGLTSGLDQFLFAVGFEEEAEIMLTGRFTQGIEEEIDLVKLDLHEETIMIGPIPVVIDVNMVIVVGVRGEVRAELVAGARQTASLELGAEWTDDGWEDISSSSFDFTILPPTLEAGVNAEAYAGGDVRVTLYGLAGPLLYANAVVGADVALNRDPFWRLYGGMDAGVGYIVDLPVVGRIADHKEDLITLRKEIGHSENDPPEVSITSPLDGATFSEGSSIDFAASVSDRESDVSIEWTLDGAVEDVNRSFSTDRLCPGDHTVTFTATDKQGESTSDTVTISVENTQPTVTILKPPPEKTEKGEGEPFELYAEVTDPTCADPSGKSVEGFRIAWEVEDGIDGVGASHLTLISTQGDGKTITASYTDRGIPAKTGSASSDLKVIAPDPSGYPPAAAIITPRPRQSFVANRNTYRLSVEGESLPDRPDGAFSWSWKRVGDTGERQVGGTGKSTTLELVLLEGVGDYEIFLSVSDDQGRTNETSITVTIHLPLL